MAQTRAASLRFLGRLPRRVLLQPRTQGRWSLKDTFAHFVAWEEEGLQRLKLIEGGRGDRLLFYDTMRQADLFNARAVRRARRWSWPALLGRAARVRARLVKAVKRLAPADLANPSHRYPVTAWLPEFAWTHERSHLARMREWRRKEKN